MSGRNTTKGEPRKMVKNERSSIPPRYSSGGEIGEVVVVWMLHFFIRSIYNYTVSYKENQVGL